MFCDPVFAEVCTGKRINRPDNRRFFQVVKRGAVNDSMEQEGDYASAAGAERKNCFCVKKDFCEPALSRFACLLPLFCQCLLAEERESLFCVSDIQPCGNGKARFVLAQRPALQRSVFRLWASGG
ncbi:hypothetical protein EL09_02220 [Salmonella enterica subsp. enterica]|nr:hypothetical protein [Salmonella enterica subsp. enterica]MIF48615.1 hypothetical protein [Salmonella enterica subsp. enterica]